MRGLGAAAAASVLRSLGRPVAVAGLSLVLAGAAGCTGGPPVPSPSSPPAATPTASTPVPEPTSEVRPDREWSGTYRAVRAARIIDTRKGLGGSAIPARGSTTLRLAGRGGIPADAAAIAATVTVISEAPGAITIYPINLSPSDTTNLYAVPGRPVTNLVVAKRGSGGRWTFTSSARSEVDVTVDVQGYFRRGMAVPGGFVPVSATRVMNTRIGFGGLTPGPDETVDLQLTGRARIPATGVSAVMLNVAVDRPRRSGHLKVYPTGTAVPTISTVNFTAGATVANSALVQVGADGRVRIANRSRGATPILVDVAGYVLAGKPVTRGAYVALPPTRIAASDTGLGLNRLRSTSLAADQRVPVNPVGPVPAVLVEAYALTATAYHSKAASYLAVGPTTRPTVYHQRGLNASGATFSPTLEVFNRSGRAHLKLDLSGYFLGGELQDYGLGAVTGQVTLEQGGAVTLARVQAYPDGVVGRQTSPVAQVPTDSDGRYTLELPPGRYRICVGQQLAAQHGFTAECFDNQRVRGCLNSCDVPVGAAGVPVEVGATTRVDVALRLR